MTLGLSMIVRNEAAVIARCLASVQPIIDRWTVVDTGSTDGTQNLIRQLMADLPGELHERSWRDFAHNRTEALELARPHSDYVLIIDADDVLEFDPQFQMPPLTADSYALQFVDACISYQRTQIVRSALPWRYRGVLHEFLTCDEARTSATLEGVRMRRNHDGARRRDAETYRRDAQILSAALETETDAFLRARYQFYLAQSWRDCGEKERAAQAYLRRAELGFWIEEVYLSLYYAANLQQDLGLPFDEVMAIYARATKALPRRLEARHGAARLCRLAERYQEGHAIASKAELAQPPAGLFVEDWIYHYGLLDELAVNAYWAGQYAISADACQRLLNEGKLPDAERARVTKNLGFALAKLNARSPARSTWVPDAPAGGTELMLAALRERLGSELDRINLQVNHPGNSSDNRPRVVWYHHNVDQRFVQWSRDKELVKSIDCFVFVSSWQREQYISAFGLPPERCVVIRHAIELDPQLRRWENGPTWRCAYTSTPFRGLDVLLDAWERLNPKNAELHVWSSMHLYRTDDAPYEHLYARAEAMTGVIYHGIAPNSELRQALRDMHFFVYPCTFQETFCLAAVEAMAAGCRVIAPSLGALPEVTSGYARIYPSIPDRQAHAAQFAENLAAELAMPWYGHPQLSLSEQLHVAAVYSWPQRIAEWRELIG